MNKTGGSDNEDYEKIAKTVAGRLVDDMMRDAGDCPQTEIPSSLESRMEAMLSAQRKKAQRRRRIHVYAAAAAVVLLVSVCCLRQSRTPGDAGWSMEIINKIPGITPEAGKPYEKETDNTTSPQESESTEESVTTN